MSHGNKILLNKSRIFNRYKQHKYADSIRTWNRAVSLWVKTNIFIPITNDTSQTIS